MPLGTGPNLASSPGAAPADRGRAARTFTPGSLLRRKHTVPERRTGIAKVLGFSGWVLAGGVALFAIWELGNFTVLIGNGPLLPAADRDSSPSVYRPAGGDTDTDGGCTQAPINRSTGETTPTDCHTRAAGSETMLALLPRS